VCGTYVARGDPLLRRSFQAAPLTAAAQLMPDPGCPCLTADDLRSPARSGTDLARPSLRTRRLRDGLSAGEAVRLRPNDCDSRVRALGLVGVRLELSGALAARVAARTYSGLRTMSFYHSRFAA
jgi:hypothetical protein